MTGKHIHIISAGENIYITFPTAIRELEHITHAFVIVEDDIFTDQSHDNEYKRVTKPKIRDAITRVHTIADIMHIQCTEIRVPDTTVDSIRDAVLSICAEHPNARYSFNITGGTKMLSLSLFLLALWLDGEVCITPGEDVLERFSIPKMHAREISKNPNHPQILRILDLPCRIAPRTDRTDGWMLRKDIENEIKKIYIPVRHEGDTKEDRILHRGTVTKMLTPLLVWNLIEETSRPGNKKEKMYRITKNGRFALKFFRENKRMC